MDIEKRHSNAPASHHHRLEDSAFLERRRKGLSRFINALVRHPVLRNDEVVTRFLTEPSVRYTCQDSLRACPKGELYRS